MKTKALEDFCANYDAVIQECRQSSEPICLTVDGRKDAVVFDYESFECRGQVRKAQQMVLEAFIDNLLGAKTYSTKEVESTIHSLFL